MSGTTPDGDQGCPTSTSTVDGYSARARKKYERAQRTIEELAPTYD